MTQAESAELLANVGLELSPSQLDLILGHVEGWPAALYLAGLALVNQPDISAAVSSFAGDDRIVVDYLRDEFLSRSARRGSASSPGARSSMSSPARLRRRAGAIRISARC
jgi:ATP/maltotriose-dependent transcriptional regulator MalT